MSKFQDFLISRGCLNCNQEEKDKLFKVYRKEYMQKHHQNRKKQQKLVQIWFDNPEYEIILKHAQELDLKVSEFIKRVIIAQRNQSYVLPNEEVLHDLIVSFSRIGTLINQVAYRVNSKKHADTNDIKAIQQLFLKLESTTLAHYQPLHLENYIREEMKKNERFLDHLQRIINDFKHLG